MMAIVIISFCIFNFNNIHVEYNFETASIIIVVLPAVLTILSIMLQLRSDRIYGVSSNEFIKLCGSLYFTFFHVLMIFLIINGIFFYLNICQTNGKSAILILELVSLIYSFIFSAQTLPVLTLNDRSLQRIIKGAIRYQKHEFKVSSQIQGHTILKIKQYLIFKTGIIEAYNCCFSQKINTINEDSLIDDLISIQSNYYRDLIECCDLIKQGQYKDELGLSINEIINTSFKNIEVLISNDKNIMQLKTQNNIVDLLVGPTLLLHRFCSISFDLADKENKWMRIIIKSMINQCMFNKVNGSGSNSNKNYSYIIQMAIYSLTCGELWFYRVMRDNDLSPLSIFSIDSCDIGLFLSAILYFAYINCNTNTDLKRKIINFTNEKCQGLNSMDFTWSTSLDAIISSIHATRNPYNLIDRLLEIYSTCNNGVFDYFSYEFNNQRNYFDEKFIINLGLEILFFSEELINHKKNLKDFLDKISIKYSNELLEVISNNWGYYQKDGKKIVIDHGKDFFELFNICKYDNNDIEILLNFVKTKQICCEANKSGKSNDEIDQILTTKLLDLLIKEIKHSSSDDINKTTICDDELTNSLYLDNCDIDEMATIFNSYGVVGKISSIISHEIHNLIEQYLVKNAKTLSLKKEDLTNKIISNLCSDDDCVEAEISIDSKRTMVQSIDDSQINYIIDTSYKAINGSYYYNEYTDDETKGVLLTRDELFDKIKGKIKYVKVVFKLKININEDKIKIKWPQQHREMPSLCWLFQETSLPLLAT